MSDEKSLALIHEPGAEFARIATTIDTSTPEGRALVFNSIQGQDRGIDSVLDQVIEVADVVQHWVDLPDPETGEISRCRRTVLILVDGTTVGCVSGGISRAIHELAALGPPPSKTTPLIVRPKAVRTRLGRRYLTLCLEMPDEPTS